jgi:hypothetical protein
VAAGNDGEWKVKISTGIEWRSEDDLSGADVELEECCIGRLPQVPRMAGRERRCTPGQAHHHRPVINVPGETVSFQHFFVPSLPVYTVYTASTVRRKPAMSRKLH